MCFTVQNSFFCNSLETGGIVIGIIGILTGLSGAISTSLLIFKTMDTDGDYEFKGLK